METADKERAFFITSTAVLLWMYPNFSPSLAIYYAMFIVTSFLMFITDKNPTINLEKKSGKNGEAWVRSAIYYGAFLFISMFIVGVIKPNITTIQSVIKSLASATPIFANSFWLSVFAFGVVVASAETCWWTRFTEWLADIFHIPITRQNIPRLIPIIIFSALTFVAFHATAKGITNNEALILTFLFMLFSLLIIIWHGEMKQGILLHINNNTISVLAHPQFQVLQKIFGF